VEEEWPCVGTDNSSFFGGECAVCSERRPCLFALHEDEGERVNLASEQRRWLCVSVYPSVPFGL
jgi:hypothetical protein